MIEVTARVNECVKPPQHTGSNLSLNSNRGGGNIIWGAVLFSNQLSCHTCLVRFGKSWHFLNRKRGWQSELKPFFLWAWNRKSSRTSLIGPGTTWWGCSSQVVPVWILLRTLSGSSLHMCLMICLVWWTLSCIECLILCERCWQPCASLSSQYASLYLPV